jgi:KaiC/GvpD/RAD55 family RecA-like ATPase
VNLIQGGPGSGKSILGMQFLLKGLEQDQHGVYITFEESKDSLIDNMSSFDWDLKNIDDKKLSIVSIKPTDLKHSVEKQAWYLWFYIEKKIRAQRIVIDSVSVYSLLFDDDAHKRRALLNMFNALRSFGCTSLVLSEHEETPDDPSTGFVGYLADSIITLYDIRKEEIRQRALEVRKMRGTNHLSKLFPMQITSQGIELFPDQTVF